MDDQRNCQSEGACQNREADNILAAIHDGTLRQKFLQLSSGDKAAGKSERADDDLERNLAHFKARYGSSAGVVFRDTNDGGRHRPESVAQRGPLGDSRHVYQAERNANSRPDDERDENPLVFRHLGIQKRGGDGEGGADFSSQNAPARSRGRTQKLERKNKKYDCGDISEIEVLLEIG